MVFAHRGTTLEFLYNNASMAYMEIVNVTALDFTGQHRTFIKRCTIFPSGYDNLEGLIVSSDHKIQVH